MHSNNCPSVSIIITAYNSGQFLRECLNSVFIEIEYAKTKLAEYEVILVDDGSTFSLDPYIREFIKNINFYRLDNNVGRGAAKNFGLSKAQYSIISFLDSDDLCSSGRYISLLEPFSTDPELDCVIGAVRNFYDNNTLNSSVVTNGIIPGSMVIKKEALEKVGLFQANYRVCDFADWYSRFINVSLSVATIEKLVLFRRVHQENSSLSEKNGYWDELFYVLRNRISVSNRTV